MNVRAVRGVCVGVGRHLEPGDVQDVDASLAKFLLGIGAVEKVADVPAQDGPKPNVPAVTGRKEN